MGDVGDYWNDHKDWQRSKREALGRDCPRCKIKQPKRDSSILLPGQRCKVDGYVDPRPVSVTREWETANGMVRK